MNAVSPPPAGWYPDPSGRAPFRYWDGARWTEHTDQGTAPSPSPTAPAAPVAPAAPMYTPAAPGFPPAAPGYAPAPGAPASAAPAAAWTAQSFVEDLKKLEGLALVVVGVVVFIVASFFSWSEGSLTVNGQKSESTSNAWDGEGLWLIRGWEVNEANATKQLGGAEPDGGTDMVILLPLALIGLAAAVGPKVGKKFANSNEIAAGATVLLGALMIGEAVHVSGATDDLVKLLDGQIYTDAVGNNFQLAAEAGVGFGLYIALIGALVAAGGAVKHYLAAKQSKV